MLNTKYIINTVELLDPEFSIEFFHMPKRKMLLFFLEGHMRKCSQNKQLSWALSYYLIHYNYKVIW